MRIAPFVALAVCFWACGPEAPQIRNLKPQTNAANLGVEAMVSGSFEYSDPNLDISSSVVELYSPTGTLLLQSPRTPISNVSAGPTGTIQFTISFVPESLGLHRYQVYVIDLTERVSNRLEERVMVNP